MEDNPPFPASARYRALPVAWVATCKTLLIAGGGPETEPRVRHALRFDWRAIRVVTRHPTPFLREARRRDLRVALHERDPVEADVAAADFVVEDTHNLALAEQIHTWCTTHGRPLNACDKPSLSSIFYMSLVFHGPLVLGISSGGEAPAVTSALRQWLEANLGGGWAMAARLLGRLRRSLPGGHARIAVLKKIARHESFSALVSANDEAGLQALIDRELRSM